MKSKPLHEDEYLDVTRYVGIIDGKYYYILNVRDIPEELREGVDLSPIPSEEIMSEEIIQ